MQAINYDQLFDIIIVGAGPAGLSLLYTLLMKEEGSQVKVLVLDLGKDFEKRDRNDPEDCSMGLGGAGIYSDGKFSFYPCGTKVWDLPDKNLLKKSYQYLEDLFKESVGLKIPSFPNDFSASKIDNKERFFLKEYPSFYLSLEERKELISKMALKGKEQNVFLFNHELIFVEKNKSCGIYNLIVEDRVNKLERSLRTKELVLAGGKLFPLLLPRIFECKRIFRRLEYGARLQAKNEIFPKIIPENFRSKNLIDPKWMYQTSDEEGIDYKTFCFCVNGETVLCEYNKRLIKCFSGRSDCPFPTGLTNFGLNIIIKKQDILDYKTFLNSKTSPFSISLKEVFESKKKIFDNEKADKIFINGLKIFKNCFQIEEIGEIQLIGPTIEGVGEYPLLNDDLKIEEEEIYVIGDAGGLFRGIIPCMLSGAYVAVKLLEKLK